jgi:hypothetical protein
VGRDATISKKIFSSPVPKKEKEYAPNFHEPLPLPPVSFWRKILKLIDGKHAFGLT